MRQRDISGTHNLQPTETQLRHFKIKTFSLRTFFDHSPSILQDYCSNFSLFCLARLSGVCQSLGEISRHLRFLCRQRQMPLSAPSDFVTEAWHINGPIVFLKRVKFDQTILSAKLLEFPILDTKPGGCEMITQPTVMAGYIRHYNSSIKDENFLIQEMHSNPL